jgi:hypothetical protein
MPGCYLAACAPYHDDAEYLAEWIEFHLLVGVERFFLYDNLSRDDHRDVLRPYVEAGIAVVHRWEIPASRSKGLPSGMVLAFEHCLGEHRDDARWIAFLDVDEFLFSPTGKPVSELLVDYEQWPAVCVSRANYGSSGHKTKPPGLVIESYLHTRNYVADARGFVKCIVDPSRTVRCASVHQFAYSEGFAVDERFRTIEGDQPIGSNVITFERLRVNHYGLKSEEELERKRSLWARAGAARMSPERRGGNVPYDHEDRSLERYVPAVRAALERRGTGR